MSKIKNNLMRKNLSKFNLQERTKKNKTWQKQKRNQMINLKFKQIQKPKFKSNLWMMMKSPLQRQKKLVARRKRRKIKEKRKDKMSKKNLRTKKATHSKTQMQKTSNSSKWKVEIRMKRIRVKTKNGNNPLILMKANKSNNKRRANKKLTKMTQTAPNPLNNKKVKSCKPSISHILPPFQVRQTSKSQVDNNPTQAKWYLALKRQ